MSKFKKAFMVTALATALTGMSVAAMAEAMEPQLLAQHTAQRVNEAGAPAPHMHGARHAGMAERMTKRHDARLARLKDALKIACIIPADDELYGVAVQKGNKETLELINKGLAAVTAKGLDKEILKKWLGTAD